MSDKDGGGGVFWRNIGAAKGLGDVCLTPVGSSQYILHNILC